MFAPLLLGKVEHFYSTKAAMEACILFFRLPGFSFWRQHFTLELIVPTADPGLTPYLYWNLILKTLPCLKCQLACPFVCSSSPFCLRHTLTFRLAFCRLLLLQKQILEQALLRGHILALSPCYRWALLAEEVLVQTEPWTPAMNWWKARNWWLTFFSFAPGLFNLFSGSFLVIPLLPHLLFPDCAIRCIQIIARSGRICRCT